MSRVHQFIQSTLESVEDAPVVIDEVAPVPTDAPGTNAITTMTDLIAEQPAIVEEVAAVEETPAPLPEVSDAQAADYEVVQSAMQERSDAVDVQLEAFGELEAVAIGLEKIAGQMQSSLNDGGLSRQAAGFAFAAVESYVGRLGLASPVAVSVESFTGQSADLRSTRVSMEDVATTLKAIWEAVKKALAAVWAGVKDFIKQVMNGTALLAQRAKILKSKAHATDGSPSKTKFKATQLAKRLAVGDKVPEYGAAVLGDLIGLIKQVGVYDVELMKVNESAFQAIKKCAAGDMDIDAFVAETAALTMPSAPKEFLRTTSSSYNTSHKTPLLPGNVVISLDIDKSSTKAMKVWKETFTPAGLTEEMTVLSTAQMDQAADMILRVCDEANQAFQRLDRSVDKFSKQQSEIVFNDQNDAKTNAALRGGLRYAQRLATETNRTTMMAVSHSVRTAGAVLEWAERSLAEYPKAA